MTRGAQSAKNVRALSGKDRETLSWFSTDDKNRVQRRNLGCLRHGSGGALKEKQQFRGRPKLAFELQCGFMEFCRGRSQSLHQQHVRAMVVFFAFLDSYELKFNENIGGISEITDAHPLLFLRYLQKSRYSATSVHKYFSYVAQIVNFSLSSQGRPPLFWPLVVTCPPRDPSV